ncbi:MAG: hypothetical protein SPI77_01255 [Corynebacterium sp.]|nr:hypothetical protein [Corynebacterium sp.]
MEFEKASEGLQAFDYDMGVWGLLSGNTGFNWLWDLLRILGNIADEISKLIGLM